MRIMTMDDFFDAIVDDIFDKLNMTKDEKPVKKEEPVKTDSVKAEKTKEYDASTNTTNPYKTYKLLPCPFCGKEAQLKTHWQTVPELNEISTRKEHYVSCSSCGCRMPDSFTENAAVEAWNKRVSNATPTKKQQLATTYLKNIAGYGKAIVDFAETCDKMLQKD